MLCNNVESMWIPFESNNLFSKKKTIFEGRIGEDGGGEREDSVLRSLVQMTNGE